MPASTTVPFGLFEPPPARWLPRVIAMFAFSLAFVIALPVTALAQPGSAAPSPAQNTAVVPDLAPFFRARHEQNVEVARQGDIELLLMGDSITDFWRNADGPFAGRSVLEEYFGHWKIANFGIAGDTTQGVLYRLQNGEGEGFSPRAVMLMIGTNNTGRNTAEEIAEGIGAVVQELRQRFPAAKILLLGVFPRGAADHPVRATIAGINQRIARLHDGEAVHYLDIGAAFLDEQGNIPESVMSDALHPSTEGYRIWAREVQAPLTQLMSVEWSTAEDRAHMMQQLGIRALRPGRSSRDDEPNAANYDETHANPYPDWPDLLTFNDGTPVTSADQWRNRRRAEIVEAFEREVYGRIPDNVPAVHWAVEATETGTVAGRAVQGQRVIGRADNSAFPLIDVDIELTLVLPADAHGPVPVMMMFRGGSLAEAVGNAEPRRFGPPGSDTPATEQLIAAGWGFAYLNPTSVQPDNGAGLTRGIIGLTNAGQPRRPDDWGALRAWSWGAARALDFLETVQAVDAQRVGIEGVSRYGKAALVTMAFEPRFAVGFIGSSGAGGVAPYRRDFGESVENLTGSGGYHWMAGNFLKYGAEEADLGPMDANDLPVDSHGLLALSAPRATFVSYGIPEQGDALWLDQQGSYMATVAAGAVYRLLGVADIGTGQHYQDAPLPAVNESRLDGRLAWRQHDGGHTTGPNWQHFIPWAERELRLRSALHPRLRDFVPVTDAMLRDPDPADWLLYSRTYDAQRYSPLDQIHRDNVAQLQRAWSHALPDGVIEVIPLVYRGVMYLATPGGRGNSSGMLALDAATGEVIWEFQPEGNISARLKSIAIYDDLVFYTLPAPSGEPAPVIALDARTGQVRWQTPVTPENPTAGVLVANGLVISGRTCNIAREHCPVVAHDARTGEEVWRFYPTAGHGEYGDDTWGDAPQSERRASSWGLPGTYDPARGLLYWGIANPMPNTRAERHDGDYDAIPRHAPAELYSNSTVALQADTGEVVWYYQHLPGDDWDMDVNHEKTLIRTEIAPDPEHVKWINPNVAHGEARDIVITVGESGGIWVNDADTGEFLWATPFPFDTPAFVLSDIDTDTGVAHINWDLVLTEPGARNVICFWNTRSYWPTAYHPQLNSLYIPYVDNCLDMTRAIPGEAGERRTGALRDGGDQSRFAGLARVDMRSGEIHRLHEGRAAHNGAVLTTGGGLVLLGDILQVLRAFDAESGEILWESEPLGASVQTSTITYEVDGRQYIAVINGENALGPRALATSGGLQPPEFRGNSINVFALP